MTLQRFVFFSSMCLFFVVVRQVLFQNKSLLYKAATTGLHALCLAMTNCFWELLSVSLWLLLCVGPHSSIYWEPPVLLPG